MVFFILINVLFYVYRFYSTKYATWREMGCADNENGLKRLIRRCLGPRCVIFFFHVFFSYSLMFFLYVYRFDFTKYATEREMGCADDENGPK